MQARFKTKEEFLQFRAEWRKAYKETAINIREYKIHIKKAGKEHDMKAQRHLQTLRIMARSLMISLDAAKATYAIDKVNRLSKEIVQAERSLTRLHYRIDPATNGRTKMIRLSKHKPTEAEIQARREAKAFAKGVEQQVEQQQVMETN